MVPKLEPTWESWFDGSAFARGLGYNEDGLVKLREADAGGWRAYVDGSERYSVFLACDERGYASPGADMTSCSCPRFRSGYLCKHIAATCCAVESVDVSVFEHRSQKGTEIEQLLDSASAEECKQFLKTLLASDARWARAFANKFGDLDVSRAREELAADFEGIIDDCSYYGFVGWNESLECEFAICGAIAQAVDPFMEKERYDEVFDVTIEALSLIRAMEVDDSNGFYGSTAGTCIAYWGKVADTGPEGELLAAQRAVAFCQQPEEEESDREEIQSYQKDDADDFVVSRFADNAATAGFVAELARDRMQGEVDPDSVWYEGRERMRARWMTILLRSLKALGKSLDELVDTAAPFMGHAEVVGFLADCAEGADEKRRAVELLEAAKASAASSSAAAGISERLLDLYEEAGDEDAQRQCLIDLVALSREDVVGDYYLKLKNLTGKTQWGKQRKGLLASTRSDLCRRVCLAAEGATAELWKEVEHAGFYELMRFEEALVCDYAEELSAIYHEKLMGDLSNANTRKGYARALSMLSRIQRFPGGDLRALETAGEIRGLYPKRPALLDELSKLGL